MARAITATARPISEALKDHLRTEVASFLERYPTFTGRKDMLCMDLIRTFNHVERHGEAVSGGYTGRTREIHEIATVGHRLATSNEGIRFTFAMRLPDGETKTFGYLYKVSGLTDETRVCGSFNNNELNNEEQGSLWFKEELHFFDLDPVDNGAGGMSEWESAIKSRSASGETAARWVETRILGRQPVVCAGNWTGQRYVYITTLLFASGLLYPVSSNERATSLSTRSNLCCLYHLQSVFKRTKPTILPS